MFFPAYSGSWWQYPPDPAPAAAVCQSEYTLFRRQFASDHQNVGVNFTGQQRGREIFVDNRVHALVIPRFSTHYRNSTAARANYDKTLLDQRVIDRNAFCGSVLRQYAAATVPARRPRGDSPVRHLQQNASQGLPAPLQFNHAGFH